MLREFPPVGFSKVILELLGFVPGNESPDRAAKAGTKGRGSDSAELASFCGQKRSFSDLIPEQGLGQVHRFIDPLSESSQVVGLQRFRGARNDDLVLLLEVLEAGDQLVDCEVGVLEMPAERPERVCRRSIRGQNRAQI